MNYKYKPEGYTIVKGDIVERIRATSKNNSIGDIGIADVFDPSSATGSVPIIGERAKDWWRAIETLPGSEARPGDTIMLVKVDRENGDWYEGIPVGTTAIVDEPVKANTSTDVTISDGKTNYYYVVEDCVVLQQAEPELLHQEWKTLYDSGVELEWSDFMISDDWLPISAWEDDSSIFNHDGCNFRRKAAKTKITGYIIDIKDSSLQDRLRLKQVLLDNGKIPGTGYLEKPDCRATEWYASNTLSHGTFNGTGSNISLEDFIQKFKKSDEVRNLAFTTERPDGFTLHQVTNITDFVGDTGDELEEIVGATKLVDDGTKGNFIQENTNLKDLFEVSYEDVFPEAVEEPAEPEFEYPIYKQGIELGMVFKFTALCTAVVIVTGDTDHKIGDICDDAVEHTNEIWQDWNPQFDYATIMQPRTVVNCTTESEANELVYWAHQQGMKRIEGDWYKSYSTNICIDLYDKSFGTIGWHMNNNYTILTMDEARNGNPKQVGKGLSDFVENIEKQIKKHKEPLQIHKITEQNMNKPKVGDKVIATSDIHIGNHPEGTIQTITKVVGNQIWVSNTNARHWNLGVNWKLYTGDAEASDTETSEPTIPTKEENMTTITYTEEEIKAMASGKKVKAAKVPKTDLQRIKKVSVMAVYFDETGLEVGAERFTGKNAEKDAFAKLNTNQYRGCTVATFTAKSIKRAAVQLENA